MVAKEVKEEILNLVRLGEPVKSIAPRFGVSTKTIYTWLSMEASVEGITPLEYNKLKRENDELKRIIGLLTLDLSRGKKGTAS